MDLKLSHFLKNKNFKKNSKKKSKEVQKRIVLEEEDKPILKIVNDQIVLDETEMFVKKGPSANMEMINEDEDGITSITYAPKSKNLKWGKNDTNMFYKALEVCGTEFSIINQLFPDRTRKQIKNKFLKEERINSKKISEILKSNKKFDLENFNLLKNSINNN